MVNECIRALILEERRAYIGPDTLDNPKDYELVYLVEMLKSDPGSTSLPSHKLSLKKSYIVMLLRNLQPKKRHVGGARYVVEFMMIIFRFYASPQVILSENI